MNNVDTMKPKDRVEGMKYLEKHDIYADALSRKNLQGGRVDITRIMVE